MNSYLERVTECDKCGEVHPGERIVDAGCFGSGGSRVRVEPDYEHAANSLANIAFNRGWPSEHPRERMIVAKAIVDAALGGTDE